MGPSSTAACTASLRAALLACALAGLVAGPLARGAAADGPAPAQGAAAAPQTAPAAPAPSGSTTLDTASPDPAKAAIPEPDVDHGYLKLGFDRLSAYKFVTPDFDPTANPKAVPPSGEEQIPAQVKAWSGRKAIITGFMLPTRMENGKTLEFLLMANQMACCYGMTPNMNDWVMVSIPGGMTAVQDVPISFRGTFTVGARFENGYLVGIYAMVAEGPGEVVPD